MYCGRFNKAPAIVRSPKGDKNTRGKILLKFSVYYSILKTFLNFVLVGNGFWRIITLLQLLKTAFCPPPPVGGREKAWPCLIGSFLEWWGFHVTLCCGAPVFLHISFGMEQGNRDPAAATVSQFRLWSWLFLETSMQPWGRLCASTPLWTILYSNAAREEMRYRNVTFSGRTFWNPLDCLCFRQH